MGITAYVFEESETSIRESGLVPEWVHYPSEPGNGVAVPAHHIFPNYLKLLRLENGQLRLVVDARAVLRGDELFQRFFGALMADPKLLPEDWGAQCGKPLDRRTARAVCDYVAGMTDRFLLQEYHRIFLKEFPL